MYSPVATNRRHCADTSTPAPSVRASSSVPYRIDAPTANRNQSVHGSIDGAAAPRHRPHRADRLRHQARGGERAAREQIAVEHAAGREHARAVEQRAQIAADAGAGAEVGRDRVHERRPLGQPQPRLVDLARQRKRNAHRADAGVERVRRRPRQERVGQAHRPVVAEAPALDRRVVLPGGVARPPLEHDAQPKVAHRDVLAGAHAPQPQPRVGRRIARRRRRRIRVRVGLHQQRQRIRRARRRASVPASASASPASTAAVNARAPSIRRRCCGSSARAARPPSPRTRRCTGCWPRGCRWGWSR